jgi:biotin carboxylase
MHVLFLAPDTHVYNHAFVRALKAIGCRVSAIGPGAPDRLPAELRRMLDGYRAVGRLFDGDGMLLQARELGRAATIDRVEVIDEPLVETAAVLRQRLQLPGLSVETAKLCRDKAAMKEFLRARGVPCARSAAAASDAEVRAFAEECGYPLVVKPLAGFGALSTHRVDSASTLDAVLAQMHPDQGRRVVVEEFVEGHEGFYDTITDDQGVRHDFAAHYYPSCLAAAQDRAVSPQIAVTNRIEGDGYRELRAMGRNVIDLLGIRNTGTHMEWFFGPSGMKFSELGARPAGEKIWDMYRVANEFDVFTEWALAVLGRPGAQQPSRRYAAGSVQIRPDRDGRVTGHTGVEAAWRRCREWIYEYELPAVGTPTRPLEKGWLVNTWFRLRHPDYDALCELMTFLGNTVKTAAA